MITLIISFILDGIVSIYTKNTIFVPLFTLVAMLIIYEKYEKKENLYFIIIGITGFLYDSLYTDIFMLNIFTFLVIGLIIKIINIYLSHKLSSNIVKLIFIIIFYRMITYFIFIILNHFSFEISILLKSIYSSILINIIYLCIITLIYKIKDKF